MKRIYPPEWRSANPWKRRFYSRYMRWLERFGYVVVGAVVLAFVYAFTYRVDDVISADGVEIKDGMVIEATLKGDAAPAARAGMEARVTGITIEPSAKTLLRASDGKTEWISGELAGDKVKSALESSLVGQSVRTRVDRRLTVTGVSEVSIDARVSSSSATGTNAHMLEPTATTVLKAKVVEGTHIANVQLSQLPPEVQRQAEDQVRAALQGQEVMTTDGQALRADDLKSAHFVVKLKAEPSEGTGPVADAAPLSREFKAKLQIVDPPSYLVAAIKAGRKVTCKVELPTGQRPIALTLLKKS
jgi:hypothetical protein